MYGLQCSEQRYIHSDVRLRNSLSRDHSSRIGGFSLSAYIPKIRMEYIEHAQLYNVHVNKKKKRLLGKCFFQVTFVDMLIKALNTLAKGIWDIC